jgi:hypothetical protein
MNVEGFYFEWCNKLESQETQGVINCKIFGLGSVIVNPIKALRPMSVVQCFFGHKQTAVALVEQAPECVWCDALVLEEVKRLVECSPSQGMDMSIVKRNIGCIGRYPQAGCFSVELISCCMKLVHNRLTVQQDIPGRMVAASLVPCCAHPVILPGTASHVISEGEADRERNTYNQRLTCLKTEMAVELPPKIALEMTMTEARNRVGAERKFVKN